MRKKCTLLVAIFVLFLCQAAYAGESSFPRCQLSPLCPSWSDQDPALQPWFKSARLKLENSLEKEKLVSEPRLNGAGCIFMLDPQGRPQDLFVSSPKSPKLDAILLNAVNDAAPFERLPVDIPLKQRFLFSFTRYPKFELKIDSFDYQFRKDPDKEFRDMKARSAQLRLKQREELR